MALDDAHHNATIAAGRVAHDIGAAVPTILSSALGWATGIDGVVNGMR